MKTIDNVKKKIIISMISILLLIITLFGITYAYFVSKVRGNENKESVSVKAGKLELTYEDGNGILEVGEYLQPGEKVKFKDSKGNKVESKTFTVTNTGTRKIDSYEVILENVINELEFYEDLTYTLTCTSYINFGEENQKEFGSCNGSNGYFPKTNGTLNSNSIDVDVTHYYVLTMEYAETHQDQSNDMQKNISAKINIQDNESSLNKLIIYGNSIHSSLPSEYQQVEYIESTGTQYINTGYKLTKDSKVKLTFEITAYNTSERVGYFGSYEDGALYQLYASGTNNQYIYASFGTEEYVQTQITSLNTPYKIVMENGNVTINDKKYSLKTATTNTSKNALIFAGTSGTARASMRLTECEIYDNGVLVRYFIPCYRKSDNVIGLYDSVNGVFYENSGSGIFEKGETTRIKSVGNYDESTGKYKIPLKISGKNIFDIVDFAETYNSYKNDSILSSFETFDGKNVLKMYGQMSSAGMSYKYMKGHFKENTQYTISLNYYQKTFNNIYGVSMYVNYTDGTKASVLTKTSSFEKWESIKFISEKNKTIAFITLTYGTGGAYTYFDNFQIEEGTTATEYEPYKALIYNIYIDQPLRKVGNYVDYIDFMNYRLVRNVGVSDDSGTKPLEESLYGLNRPIQTNIELPTLIKEDIGNIEILTDVEPSKIEY